MLLNLWKFNSISNSFKWLLPKKLGSKSNLRPAIYWFKARLGVIQEISHSGSGRFPKSVKSHWGRDCSQKGDVTHPKLFCVHFLRLCLYVMREALTKLQRETSKRLLVLLRLLNCLIQSIIIPLYWQHVLLIPVHLSVKTSAYVG